MLGHEFGISLLLGFRLGLIRESLLWYSDSIPTSRNKIAGK
jgi:hypothetical protein